MQRRSPPFAAAQGGPPPTAARRAWAALARASRVALAAGAFASAGYAIAQTCSAPGTDGPTTLTGTNVVNTYYAGNSPSVSAGSTTIGFNNTSTGSTTGFAVGDLALVIQMQGATYTTTNSITAYGDGASGAGITSLNGVGRFEFVRVTSVAAGSIGIVGAGGGGLVNSYSNSGANRYQVVRVPQYSSLTLTGSIQPARWTGNAGGVVAIDVAGVFNMNGPINAAGLGFRGGLGRALTGSNATTRNDVCAISNVNAHGAKGEGIAGQSANLLNPVAGTAEAGSDNYACTGVAGGAQQARGAPGNAGGGGTDENPSANDNNSGGGGGAGYADGGKGGNSYATNLPYGGYGGRGVVQGPNLLTMGGGGGAGSRNNSAGVQSSGGAGGGIVIVRAGRIVAGAGAAVNVSGVNANLYVPDNDAGGGGGGGGSVLLVAEQPGTGTIAVNASGGNGSNSWPNEAGAGAAHGPGGGGGGGYIGYSGSTISVAGNAANGVAGYTTTGVMRYGAADGFTGGNNGSVTPGQIPGVTGGSACYPVLTVTKSTVPSQPVQRLANSTILYRITVSNAPGRLTATSVNIADPLPSAAPAWTYQLPVITPTFTGSASRTSVSNPTVGTNTPQWGVFSIPGGGSVTFDFTVAIPTGTNPGIYQNPANVTYLDPTRTTVGGTATPGGTYSTGATVPGSNYVAASSTQEDVQVVAPTVTTLVVNKSFTPAVDNTPAPGIGGVYDTVMDITITNPGQSTVNGIYFSDLFPAVSTQAMRNQTTGSTTAVCNGGTLNATNPAALDQPGTLALSGASLGPGQSCTITRAVIVTNAIAATTSFLNNLSVGATGVSTGSASATFVTGTSAAGPPVLTKTINNATSATIAAGGSATMTLILANNNTAAITNAAITDTFPSGMVATSIASQSCNGTPGAQWTFSSGSATLAATTINAGSDCRITLNITAANPGIYTNTTSATSAAGNSNTDSATLRVVGPVVTKTFTPSTIIAGTTSTMEIRITNPSTSSDQITATAINDTYAGGLVNVNAGTLTCYDATGTATGSGARTGGTNNGTAIGMTGATIVPGGYCSLVQTVRANATYTNTTGSATATASGTTVTGQPATATLTVNPLPPPTVTKAFSTDSVVAGGTATLTITLNHSYPASAGVVTLSSPFVDSLPNSNLGQPMTIANTASLATTCGGAVTSTAAGASPASVTLASGSTIPVGGCTISVDVRVGTTVGSTYVNNIPAGALVTNIGNNTAPASATLYVPGPPAVNKSFTPANIAPGGTSTLTINLTNPTGGGSSVNNVNLTDRMPVGVNISGTPNLTNTCGGAVTLRTTTNPHQVEIVGGVVPPGGCTLTVRVTAAAAGVYDNVINAADVTSSAGSITPGTAVLATARLTVGGTSISGRVFIDNGLGGGTANDGILGTNEAGPNPGVAGIRVQLTNCAATVTATVNTDGNGNYSFAAPNTATTLCVVVDNQPGWLATGASVNTTALPPNAATTVAGTSYTFCRVATCTATQPVRSIRFTTAANTSYTNLNFGQVENNTFVADGVQQAPAGNTVVYPHVFTAGTAGTVTFTPTVTATTPAITGWSEILRRDTNCNGVLDAGETTIVTAASTFNVTAGQTICLILTEYTPPGAADGAVRVMTITSNFTYTGSAPALPATALIVTDNTTVGRADGLTLRKEVCNSTAQIALGLPCDPALTGATAGRGFAVSNNGGSGDVLIYRIIYTNRQATASSALVINDTTPPFTVHAANATCPAALTPAGLGTCAVVQPAAVGQTGAYRWTFPGTLAGNAAGVVLMTVSIQ